MIDPTYIPDDVKNITPINPVADSENKSTWRVGDIGHDIYGMRLMILMTDEYGNAKSFYHSNTDGLVAWTSNINEVAELCY